MAQGTIKLNNEQTLTIITSTPYVLEIESVWTTSQEKKPPRHYHPQQTERFEVLDGQLTVELGQELRELQPGDTLEIPPGTAHRMWNASPEPARASWRITPGMNTEKMFRFIAEGMSPLRSIKMLWTFRNEFRLTPPSRQPKP